LIQEGLFPWDVRRQAPRSAEDKIAWSSASTTPCIFMTWYLKSQGKLYVPSPLSHTHVCVKYRFRSASCTAVTQICMHVVSHKKLCRWCYVT